MTHSILVAGILCTHLVSLVAGCSGRDRAESANDARARDSGVDGILDTASSNGGGDVSDDIDSGSGAVDTVVTDIGSGEGGGTFDVAMTCDGPMAGDGPMMEGGRTDAPALETSLDATPAQVTITVNRTGSGVGSVSGSGITCPTGCSVSVSPGAVLTLVATADDSSTFGAWSGCTSTTAQTCTIMAPSTNLAVSVSFVIRQVSITVTKAGVHNAADAGNVVGPSGLNCGSQCTVMVNYSTTPISITASATGFFTFMSWGTDCTGFGACSVVPTANRTVTANFRPTVNFAFATSIFPNVPFAPITAADTICNRRAEAAGLSGTYRAWLSTTSQNAVQRLQAANATIRGWIRTDGVPFADTLTGPGSLIGSPGPLNPLSRDEFGADLTGTQFFGAYTGTKADGTVSPYNCGDYANPASQSLQGNCTKGGAAWTEDLLVSDCTSGLRLYCFQTNYSLPLSNL